MRCLPALLIGLAVSSLHPTSAVAQATPIVEIDGRSGKALVTNTTSDTVVALVALWESAEGRPNGTVDLTGPARGRVWPDSVVLAPEEFQTVRILLDDGAYRSPTRLRLETILTPRVAAADSVVTGATATRFLLQYRMLSRVEVTP
jgi:hypothetical protein